MSSSDTSTPAGRGQLKALADQQGLDNARGLALAPIADDSQRYWTAFCEEGHRSALTDLLYSQKVREVPCAEPGCDVVARSFETSHIFYLDFPRGNRPEREWPLSDLLEHWAFEEVDKSAGHRCEHDSEHKAGTYTYQAITKAAPFLCFAIRRGFSGIMQNLNHVYCPEELDLTELLDVSRLPSPDSQQPTTSSPIYDLVAVNHWQHCHFIAYVRKPVEGEEEQWVMFNDVHPQPTRKSPAVGCAGVSCSSSLLNTSANI